MRIIMAVYGSPLHGFGGVESHVKILAERLVSCGHCVWIMAASANQSAIEEQSGGVTYSYVYTPDLHAINAENSWEYRICTLFREIKADLVHAHGHIGLDLARQNFSLPYVVTLYGNSWSWAKFNIGMALRSKLTKSPRYLFEVCQLFYHFPALKRICRHIPFLITISEHEARIMREIYKVPLNSIYTVLSGIDTKLFSPSTDSRICELRIEHPLLSSDPTIVSAGRLSEEKGFQQLIKIAGRLKQFYPGIKIFILGEGDYRFHLEYLIAKNHLESTVFLVGYVNSVKLNLAFNLSDLVVIPTLFPESFGLVVAEAMSCQRAVITANNGALPEIIQHQSSGLLVDTANLDKLFDSVRLLLDNPLFRNDIARKARERISNNFTVERMTEYIIDIYVNASNRWYKTNDQ